MSADPRVVVSFAGCKTKAEATEKFCAWLDAHCDGLVRERAAKMLAANDTCKEILSQATQLRGELARQRADSLARFVEILDTVVDPDPVSPLPTRGDEKGQT